MRTIICKKCGAEIDAALGECPNCGAVYYILPTDEEKKLEWAMSTEPDVDETQVFGNDETNQTHGGTAHSTRDILNADNDELFNTRVWKISDEQDNTKTIRTQGMEKPVPPVQRPVQQRPVQQRPVRQEMKPDAMRTPAGKGQPPQKNKGILKNPLVVSGVALVAVLTLVLSIMGGLFNFSGNDDEKNKMPPVVGLTQESAETQLAGMKLDLDVKTELEKSDEVAGTVIKQSIKEGRKLNKGDRILLTIAEKKEKDETEDKEYIEVPSLTGSTFEGAKQKLSALNLDIIKDDDVYSDKEAGTIISQSPMTGAKLQKGDIVRVTISKGPETTEHAITVTAGKGGAISPKGIVNVADGENQTFTITADDGYEIREVKVDGTDIGPVSSYPFTKVTADHTLYVVFAKKSAVSPSPTATPSPSPTIPVSGTDIIA